jgi:hypothetical protein
MGSEHFVDRVDCYAGWSRQISQRCDVGCFGCEWCGYFGGVVAGRGRGGLVGLGVL